MKCMMGLMIILILATTVQADIIPASWKSLEQKHQALVTENGYLNFLDGKVSFMPLLGTVFSVYSLKMQASIYGVVDGQEIHAIVSFQKITHGMRVHWVWRTVVGKSWLTLAYYIELKQNDTGRSQTVIIDRELTDARGVDVGCLLGCVSSGSSCFTCVLACSGAWWTCLGCISPCSNAWKCIKKCF